MNKKILFTVLLLLTFNIFLLSQPAHPKREFRGAWIATVINLDWPSQPGLPTEEQKAQLIALLDGLKATGINAVVFQIRTECDAFYNSNYDPWSYWLTGSQGLPPNPYYDPLQFAVEETHKRGMELHAWFNPYRAVRNVKGSYPQANNHVTKLHPDWIVTYGNIKILDPGLPQVRDYVTNVIMDVVNRYDIDGVHFDDYFYPYPQSGIVFNDASTFSNYSRGFVNKDDWRRDNVNLLIKQIYDSIQVTKPFVKFGISPFGIWKYNVPAGIKGLSSYNELYADGIAWLQQHSIDYINPQLYWPFGGNQDYGKLMPWWADSAAANGRHFYVGQAAYRITSWGNDEMPSQIKANRSNTKVQGSVFFRTYAGLLDNPRGFRDSLINNYYKYPAIPPVMPWKDTVLPNAPQNLKFERLASKGRAGLMWNLPQQASDGDVPHKFVVYRFNSPVVQQQDIDKAENIIDITGLTENVPASVDTSNSSVYFGITSLDRNNNESSISNIVSISPPAAPILSMPADNALNQRDTTLIIWNYAEGASDYHLQVSTDSLFASGLFVDEAGAADTFKVLSNMKGLQKYYWRAKARNAAGAGVFSSVYNFTTGFPNAPLLLEPPHKTVDVPLSIKLIWAKAPAAESYRIQIANVRNIIPFTIILDTIVVNDTLLSLTNLKQNTYYFWQVSAANKFGISEWSEIFGFKTSSPVIVEKENTIPSEYSLSQNYPNPFNPATHIRFSIPETQKVNLRVYNMLGQEAAVLIDGKEMSPGTYEEIFDARGMASGIYIVRLQAGLFSQTIKIAFMK